MGERESAAIVACRIQRAQGALSCVAVLCSGGNEAKRTLILSYWDLGGRL